MDHIKEHAANASTIERYTSPSAKNGLGDFDLDRLSNLGANTLAENAEDPQPFDADEADPYLIEDNNEGGAPYETGRTSVDPEKDAFINQSTGKKNSMMYDLNLLTQKDGDENSA